MYITLNHLLYSSCCCVCKIWNARLHSDQLWSKLYETALDFSNTGCDFKNMDRYQLIRSRPSGTSTWNSGKTTTMDSNLFCYFTNLKRQDSTRCWKDFFGKYMLIRQLFCSYYDLESSLRAHGVRWYTPGGMLRVLTKHFEKPNPWRHPYDTAVRDGPWRPATRVISQPFADFAVPIPWPAIIIQNSRVTCVIFTLLSSCMCL